MRGWVRCGILGLMSYNLLQLKQIAFEPAVLQAGSCQWASIVARSRSSSHTHWIDTMGSCGGNVHVELVFALSHSSKWGTTLSKFDETH